MNSHGGEVTIAWSSDDPRSIVTALERIAKMLSERIGRLELELAVTRLTPRMLSEIEATPEGREVLAGMSFVDRLDMLEPLVRRSLKGEPISGSDGVPGVALGQLKLAARDGVLVEPTGEGG